MLNIPVAAYTKGMDIRELVEMLWIPRLEAFKPEMIFVSAGFDAHRDDDMGQLGLTENDYIWIDRAHQGHCPPLQQGAHRVLPGRGYMMGPLSRSVEAHLRVLADV